MKKIFFYLKQNKFLDFFHLKKVLFYLFFCSQFLTFFTQQQSLTKQELRLNKWYVSENYSKLGKKALNFSTKEKFRNQPLIFFYAAVGTFYSEVHINNKKSSQKNRPEDEAYLKKLSTTVDLLTHFYKKDKNKQYELQAHFFKQDILAQIYGELAYWSAHAFAEHNIRIRRLTQYYLSLEEQSAGALFLKAACEIELKDQQLKNTILQAYQKLKTISEPEKLLNTEKELLFLGIQYYIMEQKKYGADKEIKVLLEKIDQMKKKM